MPAFTVGQDSSPPKVTGVIFRIKVPIPKHVGRRIDKPGGMPEEDSYEENSVDDKGPATGEVETNTEGNLKSHAIAIKPAIVRVACQIRGIAHVKLGVEIFFAGVNHPKEVTPKETTGRRIRIFNQMLGVSMVQPVAADPKNGAALKRHGTNGSQNIL